MYIITGVIAILLGISLINMRFNLYRNFPLEKLIIKIIIALSIFMTLYAMYVHNYGAVVIQLVCVAIWMYNLRKML